MSSVADVSHLKFFVRNTDFFQPEVNYSTIKNQKKSKNSEFLRWRFHQLWGFVWYSFLAFSHTTLGSVPLAITLLSNRHVFSPYFEKSMAMKNCFFFWDFTNSNRTTVNKIRLSKAESSTKHISRTIHPVASLVLKYLLPNLHGKIWDT